MRTLMILILALAMLVGCSTIRVNPDGSIKATSIGQAVAKAEVTPATVDTPAKTEVEVKGGKLSEIFGGIFDGLINAIPFGKGTNQQPPDIIINMPDTDTAADEVAE